MYLFITFTVSGPFVKQVVDVHVVDMSAGAGFSPSGTSVVAVVSDIGVSWVMATVVVVVVVVDAGVRASTSSMDAAWPKDKLVSRDLGQISVKLPRKYSSS